MNFSKALEIAARQHNGQTDKAGNPYITHPLRVVENTKKNFDYCNGTDYDCEVYYETAIICAIMHDVVEDTEMTFEDLEKEGFSENVIEVLKLLTHNDDVLYKDYIQNILDSNNMIAVIVKMSDIEDNSRIDRITGNVEKDIKRMTKYVKAYTALTEKLAQF